MQIEIDEKCVVSERKMVALEMTESLRQKLRTEAFEREMSLSAVMRYILEQYFAKKGEENGSK